MQADGTLVSLLSNITCLVMVVKVTEHCPPRNTYPLYYTLQGDIRRLSDDFLCHSHDASRTKMVQHASVSDVDYQYNSGYEMARPFRWPCRDMP